MLNAVMRKNDKRAAWIIGIFSAIVFCVIVALSRINLGSKVDFDPHIFARINAVINSLVAVLLLAALLAVKAKRYGLHKGLMFTAMLCSILFLLSYIAHHLLAGDTSYGGEGWIRYFYFFILITHIFLAAIILPFILFTAYRALIAEWPQHRKLARITWPIWFYVAVTGVLVYFMISPYY